MSDNFRCPVCDQDMKSLRTSSEPEGIRRDVWCKSCKLTYAVHKSGFVSRCEAQPTSKTALKEECQALRASLSLAHAAEDAIAGALATAQKKHEKMVAVLQQAQTQLQMLGSILNETDKT